MRLLLDMGLSVATARHLGIVGHDAVHVTDIGQNTATDESLFAFAEEHDRVILTFDLDFARLLALLRARRPSVVLFRFDRFDTSMMNALLPPLLDRHQTALLDGAIVVVELHAERIRRLPIW